MKSFPVVALIVCTALLAGTPRICAQDYIPVFTQDYSSRLSIEVDPLTFLYRGHSIHLRYQPMFSERFLIGGGTYALDLPGPIVDLNRENRDEGWKVRIRSAYLIYAELYAKKANHGWFIGEQAGFQSFRVSNNQEVSGSTSFNNILLLTYVGYSWHPYKGSFYIKPWIGVGYTKKVDGLNHVGTLEYDMSPVFAFLTFHAGYTF
jgi:hypothetical protein